MKFITTITLIALITLTVTSLPACNGNDSVIPRARDGRLNDTEAYLSTSPYAQVLGDCIRKPCKLGTLPTIAMDFENPTIADIMTRVAVSDEWMGKRFEELLNELPAGMLPLFKSVTAIVIDGDVRPSYYTSQTATIYLDPQSMWLYKEEKPVISKQPDYRDNFSEPLKFRAPWRYVKDHDYAWRWFSLTDDSERTIDDIVTPMSQLLLHELAHANDFIPPAYANNLNPDDYPSDAIQDLSIHRISNLVRDEVSKPQSVDMTRLANISFRGNTADAIQAEYLGADVGAFFEPDFANDYYSYTSQYEDVAMMFEEVMMKYFYDIDRDLAFINSEGGIVGWGRRNRAGKEEVLVRAKFVTDLMMPHLELTDFYANYPEPIPLPTDVGWGSTLTFLKEPVEGQQKTERPIEAREEDFSRPHFPIHEE